MKCNTVIVMPCHLNTYFLEFKYQCFPINAQMVGNFG